MDVYAVQILHQLLCVLVGPVGDGHDLHLGGHHPQRQGTGVLLDQVGKRPLIAAKAGAVDNIGTLLLTVGVGVLHTKPLCQQHIDLDGDDGVLLAKDVLVLNVQLGAVEGGFVNADGVLHVQIVQNLLHDGLRGLPLLGGAFVLVLGVGGIPLAKAEGAVLQHTHGAQAVFCQLQTALEFLLQLIGTENQMTLGNGELADTDQAVHLAGVLVAEQGRGFA